METTMPANRILDREGLLYPMLVIAAVAVIISSAFGVAMMTGLLPLAVSAGDPRAEARNYAAGNQDESCGNCGVVESIAPVEMKGNGSGIGVVAGGVSGALIGNQIGSGTGKTTATIAGAAGGAFAGNGVEINTRQSVRYRVHVRMTDGSLRASYQSYVPAFAVGTNVKIVNGQIVTVW